MNLYLRAAGRVSAAASIVISTLLATGLAVSACGAEIVGRVVDNVQARVFDGAGVELQSRISPSQIGQTDEFGFFRISNVRPGPYVIEVSLQDGSSFSARLLVTPGRNMQYIELDYARAVPPDDEDAY